MWAWPCLMYFASHRSHYSGKHLSSIALGQRLHTSRRRTVHSDIVLDNAICEFVVRGLNINLFTIWQLCNVIQWVLLQFSSKCQKYCAYNFNTAELFNLSENDNNFCNNFVSRSVFMYCNYFFDGNVSFVANKDVLSLHSIHITIIFIISDTKCYYMT